MKKLKLYIDTSVLGGLFDIEDPRRVDRAVSFLNWVLWRSGDINHWSGFTR